MFVIGSTDKSIVEVDCRFTGGEHRVREGVRRADGANFFEGTRGLLNFFPDLNLVLLLKEGIFTLADAGNNLGLHISIVSLLSSSFCFSAFKITLSGLVS